MLIFKIVRSQGIEFKLFFKMMGVRHGEVRSSTMKSQLNLGEQALWTPQYCLLCFRVNLCNETQHLSLLSIRLTHSLV